MSQYLAKVEMPGPSRSILIQEVLGSEIQILWCTSLGVYP